MKTLYILLAGWVIAVACIPAGAAERETLFGAPIGHGLISGPEAKSTRINNQPSLLIGGRGAWLIDHALVLGIAGYQTVNMVVNGRMQYGGVLLGYIGNYNRPVHYSIDLLVGAGFSGYHCWHCSGDENNADTFVILEPGVNVGVNLSKFAEFGAGLSYRYIRNTNNPEVSDADFSGVSLNTYILLGLF